MLRIDADSGGDRNHMSNSIDMSSLDIEYDSDTETYCVHFDPAECEPSTAVVLAVAAVTETDPLDLASLNDCLNPDCLDGLFAPKQDGTARTGGHVTVPFADHEVTVHSDGAVVLDPH